MNPMVAEKHFAYAVMRWKQVRSYWLNFFLHFLTVPFVAAVIVMFWSFAFQGQSTVGGFSLNEMISYLVFAYFVGVCTRFTNESAETEELITSGTISGLLVRPIQFWKSRFFLRLTDALSRGTVSFFAVFFILHYFQLSLTAVLALGVLALLALSFLFNFFLYHAIGLISFWLERIWGIRFAVQWTQILLSGAFFPITLFPTAIQTALHYFPFPHTLYVPAAALAGKITPTQLLESAIILGAWTIALYALSRRMWKKGLERYDAKG